MKNYGIKKGYNSRTSYHHFDDTPMKDEYQDKVYETAHTLCEKNNLDNILDIGCGSGYKLVKYFKKYNFTGTELEPTLSWLKKKYPDNQWLEGDFTKTLGKPYDMIICADVIEHLLDPDQLLGFLKKINFKYAVISTPERDAIQKYQRGYTWMGPPNNPTHVREWSFEEFKHYLSQHFNITQHFMGQNDAEPIPLCQIVVINKIDKSNQK